MLQIITSKKLRYISRHNNNMNPNDGMCFKMVIMSHRPEESVHFTEILSAGRNKQDLLFFSKARLAIQRWHQHKSPWRAQQKDICQAKLYFWVACNRLYAVNCDVRDRKWFFMALSQQGKENRDAVLGQMSYRFYNEYYQLSYFNHLNIILMVFKWEQSSLTAN